MKIKCKRYRPDYHPAELLRLAKLGKSKNTFIAEQLISTELYYNWARNHKEFGEIDAVVDLHAFEWWTNYAMEKAEQDDFDPTIIKIMFKGRFRKFTEGVRISSLCKLKSALAQQRLLLKAATNEEVTPKDAKLIADIVQIGVNIEKVDGFDARLTAMEEAHGLINQPTT